MLKGQRDLGIPVPDGVIESYERVKDPQTGQVYEMPLESYDGTVDGYRNPKRPTEILQKTEPGE